MAVEYRKLQITLDSSQEALVVPASVIADLADWTPVVIGTAAMEIMVEKRPNGTFETHVRS